MRVSDFGLFGMYSARGGLSCAYNVNDDRGRIRTFNPSNHHVNMHMTRQENRSSKSLKDKFLELVRSKKPTGPYVRMDGWMDGWMHGWMDERVGGWMDQVM